MIAAREELKDKLLLVREGLAKLPPAHYQTLKYLVSHLVRYVILCGFTLRFKGHNSMLNRNQPHHICNQHDLLVQKGLLTVTGESFVCLQLLVNRLEDEFCP